MNKCYVILAFALAAVITVSLWFGLNDVQVADRTHAGAVNGTTAKGGNELDEKQRF